jgi:hypothetical protein
MTLAYDYPLLGVMWTIFVFYACVVFIVALFHVFADIFRSDDMGGFAKALWLAVVIIFPFVGVLVYLIARGPKMTEHAVQRAQAQDAAFQDYVKQAAGTSSPGDQLIQLASLRDSGAITPAEYEAGKTKVLA